MKSYIIMGCVCILLGLVMLIVPKGFVTAAVIAIGIAAIVNGILNFVSVRKLVDDAAFRTAITIRAVLSIIAGLVAVFLPIFFAGTIWTIVVYILAAELIVSAIIELYGIWKLRGAGLPYGVYLTEAIVSILLAAVLFAIPAAIGLTLIRIIGARVIIAGAGEIIWSVKTKV